jgi:hypothetical protein
VYYFRGLALAKQGRMAEAEVDFQVGASLEFQTEGRYEVGFALQRVQGADRVRLERIRGDMRKSRARLRQPGAVARTGPARGNGGDRWLTADAEKPPRSSATSPRLMARFTPVIPDSLGDDPSDPFAVGNGSLPIGAQAIQPARKADDKFVESKEPGKTPTQAGTRPEQQASEDDPFGAFSQEKPASPARENTGVIGSILGAIGNDADDAVDPFADDPDTERSGAANDGDLFDDLGEPAGADEEAQSDQQGEAADEDDVFGDLF